MKNFKILILSIIVLLSGWYPVKAADSNEAQDALVEIYAGTESNGKFNEVKSCEGFIIHNTSSTYILTLKQQTSINSDDSGVFKVVCNQDVMYSASEVVSSDDLNFRLLKLDSTINGKSAISLGNSRTVQSNSNCSIIGYASSEVVKKSGTIVQRVKTSDNVHYFQTSFDIADGFNGSPILDSNNYVIGISDDRIQTNGSANYILPIDDIKTILDQINVPYQSYDFDTNYENLKNLYADCETELEEGSYTKDSKAALEEQMEIVQNLLNDLSNESVVTADTLSATYDDLLQAKNQLQKKMSFTTILSIVILIITLIMSVITVHTYFIVRSLKNELSFQERRKPLPYLEYLKRNVRYELKKDTTFIGRLPGLNDICIQENPLLSRRHCQIERKNNQYWVFDCDSSNGTFVNGEKIGSQGQLLKQGDEIVLVDEKFLFNELA